MKLKTILLPMLAIWYIDLISTIIGLSVGLTEGNPKADYFFNLGQIGWAYWLIIGTFLITILALIIYQTNKYIIKKNKKKGKKTSKILLSLPQVVFIVAETIVVCRNIYYIILQL